MTLDDKELAEVSHERIVLVEGKADFYIFKNILLAHSLENDMQIIQVGGNTKFKQGLRHCVDSNQCRAVIIFSDKDSDENASFLQIKKCFTDLNLIAPTNINEAQIQKNALKLAYSNIIMLPVSQSKGAIEDLCWEAFKLYYPNEAQCVENLAICSEIDERFPIQNQKQMRVEAILSCLFPTNPKSSLVDFGKYDKFPPSIPHFTRHPTFDTIRDYLIAFSKV